MADTLADLGPGLTMPADADAPKDTAPAKRPTTREGRRAAATARKAARAAAPKPERAPTPRPKVAGKDVAGSIESLHAMLGMVALPMAGLPQTGAALAAAGPDAGKVWADAVKRYPQLERLFGAGTDGLIIFRLLMVYAPLVSMAVTEKSTPKDDTAPAAPNPLAGLMGMMAEAGVPGPMAPQPAAPPGQNSNGRP